MADTVSTVISLNYTTTGNSGTDTLTIPQGMKAISAKVTFSRPTHTYSKDVRAYQYGMESYKHASLPLYTEAEWVANYGKNLASNEEAVSYYMKAMAYRLVWDEYDLIADYQTQYTRTKSLNPNSTGFPDWEANAYFDHPYIWADIKYRESDYSTHVWDDTPKVEAPNVSGADDAELCCLLYVYTDYKYIPSNIGVEVNGSQVFSQASITEGTEYSLDPNAFLAGDNTIIVSQGSGDISATIEVTYIPATPELWAKVDGVWVKMDTGSKVKVDGTWREIDGTWVKIDGTWRKSEP